MRVKNKRVLKNGAVGGYVQQSDGSYRWRIISGPSSSTRRGGASLVDRVVNADVVKQGQKLNNFLENGTIGPLS